MLLRVLRFQEILKLFKNSWRNGPIPIKARCNFITLIDFDRKNPDENLNINKDDEIFKYIIDERILRVLFESRIFHLRNIQKIAIEKGLFFRKSFLISAPSGSGKTLIGELCAINNVFQKYGKSIYLVPFKALATEKYFHFKKSYNRFGIKVELSIGDYDVDDAKLEKADLIITTYEKMDSILRKSMLLAKAPVVRG